MSDEVWIIGGVIYLFLILWIGSRLGDYVVKQRGGNPHDFGEGNKTAAVIMWAFAISMYFAAMVYGVYIY
jgi:hypothetical protein